MKKILLLIAAMAVTSLSFAQSDDYEDSYSYSKEKSNAFFFGPKVGLAITSMTQPSKVKLYDGTGMSFSAGAQLKARFGKASENSVGGTGYFALGVELKYMNNTVKTVATDEGGKENADLSLGYFAAPVFAQVYPFAKMSGLNSLYVEAGLSLAGSISRSPKTLTAQTSKAGQIVYNIDNGGSKLGGFECRPIIGLGYTIPNTGLDINARYYIGTSDLSKQMNSKMSTAEISIAWLFNLGKF